MIQPSNPLPKELRFGASKPAVAAQEESAFGLDRVDLGNSDDLKTGRGSLLGNPNQVNSGITEAMGCFR